MLTVSECLKKVDELAMESMLLSHVLGFTGTPATALGNAQSGRYTQVVRVAPDSFHFTSRTPPVRGFGLENTSWQQAPPTAPCEARSIGDHIGPQSECH